MRTTVRFLAQNPTGSADYKRYVETIGLFRKYGAQYHFDPLMLAAQGFQESLLNQDARSPVGAIGIMQLMPATGKGCRSATSRSPSPTSAPARSTWTS